MSAQQLQPIVVRNHDKSAQLVYLDTSPELAHLMGRFRPARFVGARGGAYVLAESNLGLFADFARHHQLQVLDERHAAVSSRQSALPECFHCGQPARRGSHLAHCPGCGQPWRPIEIEERWREATTDSCPTCHSRQPAGFGWCGRCGAPMPGHTPTHAITRPGSRQPEPIGAILPGLQLEDGQPLTAAMESELAAANSHAAQQDS